MDRRDFIRFSIVGGVTGIVAPKLALAGVPDSPFAGSVFYTKDAPGRWSKKVGGHLPNLEIDKSAGLIQVVTGHEMRGFDHYIVKHVLLDRNYQLIDEKMFNPMTDKTPISTFKLNGYSGPLYALSVCNKHDTWLNLVEV
ncbi:class II SORL domain-containing protein [Photobacterium sp. SDRW27]|uniref:hypothetical protein n=1 Tax=Photobacterium obscurum TaxID=2829490 RepID=UPI0022431808|nr:hypothetical protein [Photobacterium obscurum]MCW8327644.1 class II SORL domain-containing protein [Photobacterium obscurum]